MQRKLLGIINVDLDATAQLLIIRGGVKHLKVYISIKINIYGLHLTHHHILGILKILEKKCE